jgi:hypothetical protein
MLGRNIADKYDHDSQVTTDSRIEQSGQIFPASLINTNLSVFSTKFPPPMVHDGGTLLLLQQPTAHRSES